MTKDIFFFFFLAQKSSAIFKHYIYVIKWSCKLMFCLLKMIILFKFRDHSPMKGTNSKYYFLIHLLWNNLFLWPKSSQRQTIFYCFFIPLVQPDSPAQEEAISSMSLINQCIQVLSTMLCYSNSVCNSWVRAGSRELNSCHNWKVKHVGEKEVDVEPSPWQS